MTNFGKDMINLVNRNYQWRRRRLNIMAQNRWISCGECFCLYWVLSCL